MSMQIKYCGPLDSKRFRKVHFARLVPVTVSDDIGSAALAHPTVFLPADAEVPADVLALRDQHPHAVIAEGKSRLKLANRLMTKAEELPDSDPRQASYKAMSIKGAQDEIDHAEGLIAKGQALIAARKAEKVDAAVETATEDEAPKVRRRKSETTDIGAAE
jgi:hypothetical protein